MRAEPIAFANIFRREGVSSADPVSLAEHVNSQFDPRLSWDDIAWFRSNWKGPIVIKGIQTLEDARIAADVGVEAIALSNHGGRQLDGAPPPLELVAPVAEAVGDRVEIICDGGIRRGGDIAKAVALGAQACMSGGLPVRLWAPAAERWRPTSPSRYCAGASSRPWPPGLPRIEALPRTSSNGGKADTFE
jgi:L-lactate dehydrogenase (cytochrome)